MLAIKLRRVGKKGQVSFRVAVMEKRSKLQGKFVEDLGWWNPHFDKSEINKERASYWLKVGAQPTPTVHNLFVRKKILSGPKMPVHKKSKKEVGVKDATEGELQAAVPAAQEMPNKETSIDAASQL
jgi:small subunit ribosomal protein S16